MESIVHIQGSLTSSLTPLFLVHAVSGLAFSYFALPSLSTHLPDSQTRPVYGISSPVYDGELSQPYRLPKSIREIAIQYITLIKDIQPEGPYLLGGWSMGGMIALKMAEILRQRGERVLHVVMIDSGNPRHYPDFVGEWESDLVLKTTYNSIAGRLGARQLPITLGGGITEPESPAIGDDDDEIVMDFTGLRDLDTPDSSDVEDNEDEDDEDEADSYMAYMAKQLFRYVKNGINIITKVKHTEPLVPTPNKAIQAVADIGDLPTPPLSPSTSFISLPSFEAFAPRVSDTYTGPVTLVKCTALGKVNLMLSHERKSAIQKIFFDERMGWSKEELPNLRVMKVNCTHDRCFDPNFVGQIADRLRKVLRTVY